MMLTTFIPLSEGSDEALLNRLDGRQPKTELGDATANVVSILALKVRGI